MKRALLVLVALMLAACEDSYSYNGQLILDGAHRVGRGETVTADIWVTGGQLTLESGSRVTSSVYVLWDGVVDADGEILGDLSVLDGALSIGPHATVGGNLNLGGGTITRSPEAIIAGTVNTSLQIPASQTELRGKWANHWFWLVSNALLLAMAAFVAVRFAPGPVACVAQAAAHHPIVAGAMGLLAGIVGLALLVQMAFTIVLIPVTLLGLLLFFVAVAYGWVAAGLAVGQRLVQWRRWKITPPLSAALGTLLFVLAVNALGLIPIVTGLVPIVAAAIGLGAVVLTRFGAQMFVSMTDAPYDIFD